MKNRTILEALFFASVATFTGCKHEKQQTRPNILICVSDDQSFPHAGAYGCQWVKTPNFDKVAGHGILFTHAYTPNAKCAPSRSCIITGRNPWQLEAAANHVPYFPEKFKTYAEVLIENGYHVGHVAKGWAPGNPGMKDGNKRELLGPAYNKFKTVPPTDQMSNIDYARNFEDFLEANPDNKPFCFWFGCTEPHREYEFRSGKNKGGKDTGDIDRVFNFWPDNDTVRNDMLDYAFEIEYFDQHLGKMLKILEEKGLLENTLVLVTSDNGMPFPRAKGQEYEISNHLPLAMMWPKGIKQPGRVVSDFVSFTDFAPTFLAMAGIDPAKSGMQKMEGQSLLPILSNEPGAHGRDYMVIGRERQDVGRPDDQGYPIRGIFSDNFLYLSNFRPDRWPAGNPETGYMDTDGSPTKTFILNDRRSKGKSWYWDVNFGKRSGEELYRLSTDPDCVTNLADSMEYAMVKQSLQGQLTSELTKEGDPRMAGDGDIFDRYPYSGESFRFFYNRFMAGEKLNAGWIRQTDIEKERLE